jgi:hypothetical protein
MKKMKLIISIDIIIGIIHQSIAGCSQLCSREILLQTYKNLYDGDKYR